jgi:hypothetical protein
MNAVIKKKTFIIFGNKELKREDGLKRGEGQARTLILTNAIGRPTARMVKP